MSQISMTQGGSLSAGSPNPLYWVILALIVLFVPVIYWDGLTYMVKSWGADEYSHGYLIPVIALYMAWLQRADLFRVLARQQSQPPSLVPGGLLLLFALLLFVMGELGTVYTLIQYGFLFAVWALFLLALGTRGVWVLRGALFYLVFMIPLPNFFYNNLSAWLQLISSELGVMGLRWMGVSVFLEGNMIDLGNYQLQVAEACSGLRYLFPLLSFSFLVACFYRRSWVWRTLLVVSALPITVVMNSFRIAIIGLSVDIWGIHMAEGVLHAFEGWVIFIACLALLAGEVWLIEKLHRSSGGMMGALNFDAEGLSETDRQAAPAYLASVTRRLRLAVLLLVPAVLLALSLDNREEQVPERSRFQVFPLFHSGWLGREQGFSAEIVDALKVSDYINADYQHPDLNLPVNLYVAYYESQRKGASVHSPRSCIPGDGWVITDIEPLNLDDALGISRPEGAPERIIRRVIIQKGENRNLVYYWFNQRGRVFSNEYLAKWYIFQDSLLRDRTDGSLVRLVTPMLEKEPADAADERLLRFARDFDPLWNAYIPE